jgi:hypothetical protein
VAGATRSSARAWVRVIATVVLAGVLVTPPAVVALWSVLDGTEHRDFVSAERSGVAYLRPLTKLIAALVSGQSAAVRGESVDIQSINNAATQVAAAQRAHGRTLRTDDRWSALQGRIQALTGQPSGRGVDGYRQWSDAVGLATALATRVGDTSNLILDPDLDSHYLVDAGLFRLPTVIQGAGQLADLVALTGSRQNVADDVRIAVLRDRIASAAAAVNAGLGKVVDATASGHIGTALLGPLDRFGAAADALAPSVDVLATPELPKNVPAAAFGVQLAAVQLADGVWRELDALLADRLADLRRVGVEVLALTGTGILLALVVVVFATRQRSGRPERPDGGAEPTAGGRVPVGAAAP